MAPTGVFIFAKSCAKTQEYQIGLLFALFDEKNARFLAKATKKCKKVDFV